MIERGHHDMGGLPAGRVERTEHDYAEWERRVDAMAVLLWGLKGGQRRFTVDEHRNAIEGLPPHVYDARSYYEKWILALGQCLLRRGIVTSNELARKMGDACFERMHHDMGGLPAGRVERTEHDYAEWERRVDAMSVLLRARDITVDERRRHIEELPPEEYDRMSYYERWVVSLSRALVQRGVVTTDEIGRKMAEVNGRGEKRRG